MRRPKQSKARARARALPPGTMNRTEARYAEHLGTLRAAGTILSWSFERWKIRLAPRTWYCPDFRVISQDREIEFHEVKARHGHGKAGWRDDARVKIKVAAAIDPWMKFIAVWPGAAPETWEREEF